MQEEKSVLIQKMSHDDIGIVDELRNQGFTSINEYLILGVSKKEFKNVYEVLKDKNTIELTEPYDIIGQTIDGDWVLYKECKVLFVHNSLDKNMVEEFNLTVKDFLLGVLNKNLDSKWIAR